MAKEEHPNILRHFIVEETGTTRFLATMLEPHPNETIQGVQRTLWKRLHQYFAERAVVLQDSIPQTVCPGYEAGGREIDLIIIWGGWLVALENKVRAQSIRPGQIQRQYDVIKNDIVAGHWDDEGYGAHTRVCMVFLVPKEGVGVGELERLQVKEEEGDRKLYITWTDLLDWLSDLHWPTDLEEGIVMSRLARDGITLIERIIETGVYRSPVYPPTPARQRLRDFMRSLQNEIEYRSRELALPSPIHFKPKWSSRDLEEIYACLEGFHGRSVYLQVAEQNELDDERAWNLAGRLYFKIEKRGRAICLPRLRKLTDAQISEALAPYCIDLGDWEDLIRSEDEVSQSFNLQGSVDKLHDVLVMRFLGFVNAFRDVLGPQENEKT